MRLHLAAPSSAASSALRSWPNHSGWRPWTDQDRLRAGRGRNGQPDCLIAKKDQEDIDESSRLRSQGPRTMPGPHLSARCQPQPSLRPAYQAPVLLDRPQSRQEAQRLAGRSGKCGDRRYIAEGSSAGKALAGGRLAGGGGRMIFKRAASGG